MFKSFIFLNLKVNFKATAIKLRVKVLKIKPKVVFYRKRLFIEKDFLKEVSKTSKNVKQKS